MIFSLEAARRLAYDVYSGFWKVGDSCFFDKGDCLRYATATQQMNVTYHFFDEVYQTLDWTAEPTESLNYLYTERAKQLRDKYEHIALSFSGGVDSTNILQTFLKNNIKLDEVVAWYPVKASEKLLINFNSKNKHAGNIIFEYQEAVVPVFKWLAKHHPEIKLTVLDYTDTPFDVVNKTQMHDVTIGGCVSHAMTTGQYLMTEHLRKYNKTCCQLLGVDKPRVVYSRNDNQWYTYFLDFNTLLGHWPQSTFNGNEPKTEYFYYSFDMPKITQKQCFEIKKAFQFVDKTPTNPHFEDLFSFAGKTKPGIVRVNPQHDIFKKIIYPDCNLETYQAGKASVYFYHEQTTWFLDAIKNDKRITDFYDGQIYEMIHGVHPDFMEYMFDGRPAKFKDMISKIIPF